MLSWIGKKGGYHWNSPVSFFIDRTKIKLWSSICGRSRLNFPPCHAKKNLGNYSRCCKGGGPVEKILWQTIHRWIRNTKRQGRFVSTSRNLKQRLLDRVGRLKCCRDTMRTNFYRPEGPAFVGSGCCGCRLLVFDAATVSRIQFAQHNVSSVHGVRVTVFLLPSCA